jgi:hypothetical protein
MTCGLYRAAARKMAARACWSIKLPCEQPMIKALFHLVPMQFGPSYLDALLDFLDGLNRYAHRRRADFHKLERRSVNANALSMLCLFHLVSLVEGPGPAYQPSGKVTLPVNTH